MIHIVVILNTLIGFVLVLLAVCSNSLQLGLSDPVRWTLGILGFILMLRFSVNSGEDK